jgi:hypothetical protein
MARKGIVVGDTVNGNQILSISGEGKQRKYEIKRPCGHSSLLGSWQLLYGKPKEGFSGCAACRISVHTPASVQMIGRKIGTFAVLSLSEKRVNNRRLWDVKCTVCGFEKTVSSAVIVQNKPNVCKQCKNLVDEKVRTNPRVFTPEETEILTGKIRAGVFSVQGNRPRVDHLKVTELDDRIQNAWAQLLKTDLQDKSWDNICALACVCGKNQSKRLFNKPVARFIEPYTDADGEEVRSVNDLATPEPNYEPEDDRDDRETLHEALGDLTPDERALLLKEPGDLTMSEKTVYAVLMARLKSSLQIPSIQIQPLY